MTEEMQRLARELARKVRAIDVLNHNQEVNDLAKRYLELDAKFERGEL